MNQRTLSGMRAWSQGYVGLLPLTPLNQMYVGIGIAAVVVILRAVTTQPLSSK